MGSVTSKDGTVIAYERAGSGPAVILVGGGMDDGAENAPLVPLLAKHFTVYNYARRGRGGSGDTPPYALTREIEDIDALLAEAGGSAHAFGASSGGALLLEAVAAGSAIGRFAVYEVPYFTTDYALARWQEYVEQLGRALADGRRGRAVELFMRVAGASEEDIAGARSSVLWPGLEKLAPTLAYDAACMVDGRPPVARLARITCPALVFTGGRDDIFEQAADAIAAAIPGADRRTLQGAGHAVDAATFAPVLHGFFR